MNAQLGLLKDLENGDITADIFHEELRKAVGKDITDSQIDDAWNSFWLAFLLISWICC